MILCVSVTSLGLLVGGSARVAFAASASPADTVRTPGDRLRPHGDSLRAPRVEDDSLRGRSGKLRAVLVPRSERPVGILERMFGDSLLRTPGVHAVPDSSAAE